MAQRKSLVLRSAARGLGGASRSTHGSDPAPLRNHMRLPCLGRQMGELRAELDDAFPDDPEAGVLRRRAGERAVVVPHLSERQLRQAAPEHRSRRNAAAVVRSEEHTSELQSLMRISYAVFCLKKKTTTRQMQQNTNK